MGRTPSCLMFRDAAPSAAASGGEPPTWTEHAAALGAGHILTVVATCGGASAMLSSVTVVPPLLFVCVHQQLIGDPGDPFHHLGITPLGGTLPSQRPAPTSETRCKGTSAAPTESAYSPSGLTDPAHSVASATRYPGPKSPLSTSFPSCSARPTHEYQPTRQGSRASAQYHRAGDGRAASDELPSVEPRRSSQLPHHRANCFCRIGHVERETGHLQIVIFDESKMERLTKRRRHWIDEDDTPATISLPVGE